MYLKYQKVLRKIAAVSDMLLYIVLVLLFMMNSYKQVSIF